MKDKICKHNLVKIDLHGCKWACTECGFYLEDEFLFNPNKSLDGSDEN